MKAQIHPQWYPQAKVTCACGSEFTTGSTMPEMRVEICSSCHPFFTGQQKFVDTLGTVERFQKRAHEAKTKQEQKKLVLEEKRTKREEEKREKPTLKDLLMQIRKEAS